MIDLQPVQAHLNQDCQIGFLQPIPVTLDHRGMGEDGHAARTVDLLDGLLDEAYASPSQGCFSATL